MNVTIEPGQSLFTKPSIEQQISEVDCELRVRRSTCRVLVGLGEMSQADADERIRLMAQVKETLKFVMRNADVIKKAVAP